ncbi:endolytic transglycosylase MltG [Chroococcidiopsis sp.]|uniref:endolytic transglycosylase MltG n=1 Tax=Chroococcidiopsis sp. TaxID=3088168 RepID=UPI003F35A140
MQKLFKWRIIWALIPLTLGVGAWSSWNWWQRSSAPSQPLETANATQVQFRVHPGTASQQIGKQLEAEGLIRSSQAWNLWARWLHWRNSNGGFQAGTYQISPSQSLEEVANKIWHGQVVQQSFTIPEGWSLRQMAAYFEQQGYFPASEFLNAASQIKRDRFSWLPADIPHLEGYLYPDTYKIGSGSVTPTQVVNQMLQRFEQVALPLYEQGKDRTDFDLKQWVTLASIVEKEAVIPQERSRIAGVFVKRLQKGYTLGSDPTVEYALNLRQTADQPLTYAQVNTPSPYNTYRNPGLPPTPIASPGIASLKAALDPESTSYLYFVARYDGSHVFSRTLAEHNAAQAAIRRQRQKG